MISRPGLFFAMLIGMAVVMPAQADKLDDIIASGKLRCAVVRLRHKKPSFVLIPRPRGPSLLSAAEPVEIVPEPLI